jgi:hypothetical protein
LFDNCVNTQVQKAGLTLMRGRMARLLAGMGLMAAVSGAMAASETLYYFVDDRGIPHFTNVPVDARYRPFAKVSTGPAEVRESVEDAVDAAPYADEPVHIEEPLPTGMDHEVIVSDHHLPVETQEH